MIELSAKVDEAMLRHVINAFTVAPDRAAQACAWALNRAVRSTRQAAAKEISEEMGMVKGTLTRNHRFGSARPGGKGKALDVKLATPDDLEARLMVRGGRIPVTFFRYEQTPLVSIKPHLVFDPSRPGRRRGKGYFVVARGRHGTSWTVGSRTTFGKQTFYAQMDSGHKGIWTRRPGSRKLWEVTTISVPAMAQRNLTVRNAIMRSGAEALNKRLRYEILAFIRRLARDSGVKLPSATRYRQITGGLAQ